MATSPSPQPLSTAVRDALAELESQRTRLREIRDLTLGDRQPAPIPIEDNISNAFLEKVFDHTVDLTLERLNRVIDQLEEALDGDREHLRLV